MSIIEHTGDVLLYMYNLAISGDASIKQVEGSVMLTNRNLSLEDISIACVSEDVTVDNNTYQSNSDRGGG